MKLIVLSALLLGACATQPQPVWEKPGSTYADFQADSGYCRAQAFGAANAMGNLLQVAIIQRSCMEGKGWQLVEPQ